jgi:Family of unknown function (DUF6011)
MRYHAFEHAGKKFWLNQRGELYLAPRWKTWCAVPEHTPEELEAARALAAEYWSERRRESCRKAVETRRRRLDEKYYDTAARLLVNEKMGPRETCCICRKPLTDPPSISRGIGPECWSRVVEYRVLLEKRWLTAAEMIVAGAALQPSGAWLEMATRAVPAMREARRIGLR